MKTMLEMKKTHQNLLFQKRRSLSRLVVVMFVTITLIIVPVHGSMQIGQVTFNNAPYIAIVSPKVADTSINMVTTNLKHEFNKFGLSYYEKEVESSQSMATTIQQISRLHFLIVVGHGSDQGLLIGKEVLEWNSISVMLKDRDEKGFPTFFLSCNSLNSDAVDLSNYFGFSGAVDATAAWNILEYILHVSIVPRFNHCSLRNENSRSVVFS